MTPKQAAERILELDKEATPGEWGTVGDDIDITHVESKSLPTGEDHEHEVYYTVCTMPQEYGYNACNFGTIPNANFIAETRTLAPQVAKALLEALDKLEENRNALLEFYGTELELRTAIGGMFKESLDKLERLRIKKVEK